MEHSPQGRNFIPTYLFGKGPVPNDCKKGIKSEEKSDFIRILLVPWALFKIDLEKLYLPMVRRVRAYLHYCISANHETSCQRFI